LLLPRAVFLHVPKTGGSWVGAALRAAGVRFDEYLIEGDPHGDPSYCPRPDAFKFAFVRHPLDVYRSYWRFKMDRFDGRRPWDAQNPFDRDCASPDFDEFVRKVVEQYPGWCSRMFEDYVGPATREIEFVGRFERLRQDLVRALTLAGERFDERAIMTTPPENASVWPSPAWTPALERAALESERDALVRFGYRVP
jgi:hypothetical protein